MYGVTEFGARAIFNRGVHEKFPTITGATGTVDHNVMNGHVFYSQVRGRLDSKFYKFRISTRRCNPT